MELKNEKIENISTMEKPIESEELIMDRRDVEKIDEIIKNIGQEERQLTFQDYNENQIEEARKDPNRHLTALKKGKKDNEVSDEELLLHFITERDKHGFSLSTRFSLENIRYRKDLLDEDIRQNYLNLQKKIIKALEEIEANK